jgi:cytochrome c
MPSVNKHSITSLKPAAIALLAFSFFTASSVLAQGDTLADFTPTLSDSFKQLMRDASVEDGEEIFMRKCSSCHDHEKDGGHGKGPHLWNVLGRKAGSAPGFDYSDAMKNIGHTWNLATINYYLTRTDRAVPGRAMDFRGIRRDKVRAKLLRFLMTINDNPPALP